MALPSCKNTHLLKYSCVLIYFIAILQYVGSYFKTWKQGLEHTVFSANLLKKLPFN